MSTWLWAGVLVVALWGAHWGADRLAEPLRKLRRQWGLSQAAGGALVALATVTPELGINITAALRGVADIGLGNTLGANVLALPLVVTVAYFASRAKRLGGGRERSGAGATDAGQNHGGGGVESRDTGSDEAEEEGPAEHARHLREHLLHVRREATTVLAVPYLAVIALFALLTVPPRWRGLQAVDGWILLATFAVFLGQALLRGRQRRQDVSWERKESLLAVAAVGALAAATYLTVLSAEQIIPALGLSEIVGGIFVTATVSALPETFATWKLTRSGQGTAAVTTVIADKAATLSLALFPLALVTTPLGDFAVFVTVLAFAALVAVLYAVFIPFGARQPGFARWQVLALDGVYVAFVGVLVFGVLRSG